MTKHIIKLVKPGSIAEEMGLEPGDKILKINDMEIEDIFDYQFFCQDEYVEVLVEAKTGEECVLEIDKDPDEDLGIEFEQGLMDEYHSCHNKCIFCFIDQMPKGMRETLYFKDDDTRLSFLQGNYVTLTNLSDKDVNRMIRYRLEPVNISFQTMNPELRCMMLNNRFAGDALKKVDKLYEAEILMNGQIVLCKGVNDKDELRFSLEKLLEYHPVLQSVSVVPVGLSKYRDGLYPLEPFTKEDAIETIAIIEEFQKKALEKSGMHFVHASDEFYLLADMELPEEERYDGYLQIENGVGMLRSFMDEAFCAIEKIKKTGRVIIDTGTKDCIEDSITKDFITEDSVSEDFITEDDELEEYSQSNDDSLQYDDYAVELTLDDNYSEYLSKRIASKIKLVDSNYSNLYKDNANFVPDEISEEYDVNMMDEISVATGRLAASSIQHILDKLKEVVPGLKVNLYPIRNDFFGERITVSGLITGQDIMAQLKDKRLGTRLCIPENMLRSGENVFLDDVTLSQVQNALQVPVTIVKSSGVGFIKSILLG